MSGLRIGTRKFVRFWDGICIFSDLWNEIQKFFLFIELKTEFFQFQFRKMKKNSGCHFIRIYPGIPVYGKMFRIIPVPKLNFPPGILETQGTAFENHTLKAININHLKK